VYQLFTLVSALLFTAPTVSDAQPARVEHEAQDALVTVRQTSRAHLARLNHDHETVLKHFDQLADQLHRLYAKERSLKGEEVQAIYAALDYAADKHRLQMRKNKEKTPYISHPIIVTSQLIDGGVRESSVIIASLLHDTIQDGHATFEELHKQFGSDVATIVREVTMDLKLPNGDRKRKLVVDAVKKSPGATQILMADMICNLNELMQTPPEHWTRVHVERYFQWSQTVLDRLPPSNEKMKGETQNLINAFWEKQKDAVQR
jgi:(p)ppGpp synthase/HD superfamily hydrolase